MSTHTMFGVCDASLFFGSARPNQAGEAHHAESLFPPPPSTFQGAVRSSLYRALRAEGLGRDQILHYVGPPDRLASGWQLDGPWVTAVRSTPDGERLLPWVPLPRCVAGSLPERRRDDPALPRRRRSHRGWTLRDTAPVPDDLHLDPEAPPELVLGESATDHLWLPADELYQLLRSGRVTAKEHETPPFARPESRVGLALEEGVRTAEDAMLYFQRKWRMSGVVDISRSGLAAWLRVPDKDDHHVQRILARPLRLGRRNRPLSLESHPPRLHAAWTDLQTGAHIGKLPHDRLRDPTSAWLILASPVALDDPAWGTPAQPRIQAPGPVQVQVQSAILGRPLHIGGLDFSSKGGPVPRPVRAYLSPGASWRIRLSGGSPEDRQRALLSLHHACTLGATSARSFGFGRTWIALSPPESSP